MEMHRLYILIPAPHQEKKFLAKEPLQPPYLFPALSHISKTYIRAPQRAARGQSERLVCYQFFPCAKLALAEREIQSQKCFFNLARSSPSLSCFLSLHTHTKTNKAGE